MPSSVSTISSKFQSTLSVRRATGQHDHASGQHLISIHALRKESDDWGSDSIGEQPISIHALRKESDNIAIIGDSISYDFNPRSP